MYTQSSKQTIEKVLSEESGEVDSADEHSHFLTTSPPSFIIKVQKSTRLRTKLKTEAIQMVPSIYFYHEKNPHQGLLANLKQILYDFYDMIGPVKDTWMKILLRDSELLDLLRFHTAGSKRDIVRLLIL